MAHLAARVGKIQTFGLYKVRAAVAKHPSSVSFLFGDLPDKNPRVIQETSALGLGLPGGYRPPRGEQVVRQVIGRDLARIGVDVDPDKQVCVVNGVLEGLHLAAKAMLEPGDKAIVPAPYYFYYPDHARMVDAEVIFVSTQAINGFKMTPQELRIALLEDRRIKLLFLNSPLNPVGSCYTKEEFETLAKVLEEFPDVWVISDEVYERLMLDGQQHVSFWAAAPQLRGRTIVLNSLSKSTGLSEYRAGWAAGPQNIIDAIDILKGPSSWATSSLAQQAIYSALSDQDRFAREVNEAILRLRGRRDHMFDRLVHMGLNVPAAPAGIFLFPQIPTGITMGSTAFAVDMVERNQVAVVPGADHGVDTHFRLPFTMPIEVMDVGLDRLAKHLKEQVG